MLQSKFQGRNQDQSQLFTTSRVTIGEKKTGVEYRGDDVKNYG